MNFQETENIKKIIDDHVKKSNIIEMEGSPQDHKIKPSKAGEVFIDKKNKKVYISSSTEFIKLN